MNIEEYEKELNYKSASDNMLTNKGVNDNYRIMELKILELMNDVGSYNYQRLSFCLDDMIDEEEIKYWSPYVYDEYSLNGVHIVYINGETKTYLF